MKYHLKNKMTKRFSFLFGFVCTLSVLFIPRYVFSQDFPSPVKPPRLVNDFAKILSEEEADNIEAKLLSFNDSTSTQISVVSVKDIYGYPISDYAQRLAEEWGVGQKGKDNGIMMLIKPGTSESRGEIFIATGYGLEGALPDAVVNRIIRDHILPEFKAGSYYKGIEAGTDKIIEAVKGEFHSTKGKSDGNTAFILVGFLIFIYIIRTLSKRRNNGRFTGKGSISFGNYSEKDSFGGFESFSEGSSFEGSSFEESSFGGFGGGSFGGGGAGGSW